MTEIEIAIMKRVLLFLPGTHTGSFVFQHTNVLFYKFILWSRNIITHFHHDHCSQTSDFDSFKAIVSRVCNDSLRIWVVLYNDRKFVLTGTAPEVSANMCVHQVLRVVGRA